MYPEIQQREVIMNALHPRRARPPRLLPPVLWTGGGSKMAWLASVLALTETSDQSNLMPHCCSAQVVQSYKSGRTNVNSHLMHGSLGPLVQQFLQDTAM